MIILCATMDPASSPWPDAIYERSLDLSVVEKYQRLFLGIENSADIAFYVHDDLVIHESNWESRVKAEFADPQVVIAGFGGALGMGTDDIYKRPYRIEQLVRRDYFSNQRDWEVHGKRETGARDVAVVDGFAMAIRLAWLREIGGWPWMRSGFHCYDTAMCLRALREGKKVRMVGIDCTHNGGGTSTSTAYADWCREHNTTMEKEHSEPHRWLYDWAREILPVRI